MTRSFRVAAIGMLSLTALAACSAEHDGSASGNGLLQQSLFDCADVSQRLSCPAPVDASKRFVCHASGDDAAPYVKIKVSKSSSAHAAGVAHDGLTYADQAPGASGADIGSGPGLDCECTVRVCRGSCTGAAAGTACDDGDKCTGEGTCSGDTCLAGTASCAAGTPVDACNTQSGACDASTGECLVQPSPFDTPCGSGMICDGKGACVDVPRVVINEVESSGGVPGDWVELFNTGSIAANVSGFRILDNDNAHTAYVIPDGTLVPPGGYLVLEEAAFGFGLGSADSARLFGRAGELLDSYSWSTHAITTYGRCPDGTGAFRTTNGATKGSANDCAPAIRINEVESSGGVPGDWVELANVGPIPLDLSAWVLKDNDDTHAYVFPAGTTVAPGAYLVLEEASFGFGLGSADSVRILDPTGVAIDTYSWTAHATTTYGRCPSGTGAFTTTTAITKGAANACTGGAGPWPGRDAVTTADAAGAFGANLSGLYYEPATSSGADVVWAVRNGPSTLFRLVWDGAIWAPELGTAWESGKTLRYRDGTGAPDAEGVTMAESSSPVIYVATERDNDANTVSRPSILRFDLGQQGGELVATHEWNLVTDLPVVGANLGLEALTWIPDSFLVASSFFDENKGRAYAPADYPDHGAGLFFVGVEANGTVYAYALDHQSGGFARVATIVTGDVVSKGLSFDRDVGYLWALCGAACGNQLGVWGIDTASSSSTFGRFKLFARFSRPTTMANLANEGIAIEPESRCSGGQKRFFWTDDGNTDNHALRADTIPCGKFIP